ncbi:MAG TPA: response regulator [Gemmataceae bacterium]|nr:response regulator [Gemmataceae bacterium]
MLVLSRRINEKILIPNINTAIEVVSVKRGVVRLGIAAPPEVTILREELSRLTTSPTSPVSTPPVPAADEQTLRKLMGQLRDRLHVTGVGLGTVQLLLDTGNTDEAREVLSRIRDDLQLLRRGVEGELDETPPEPPARPCKPRKALLVEDDRYQRDLLAGFLRMAGLEVDTAGDGSDALDYLRSQPRPDVVLMDMGLPRCDGATTVRHIRRDPSYAGLRIYAVTGSAPGDFDLDRGPAGIDRWFQKPLDPSALLHDLKKELDDSLCCV